MFWDRVSGIYDLFGKIYNGKVNREMCTAVAKEIKADDRVLSFSNVEIRAADILKLPFPDESFDVVIAANVIHLLDDPYKALSELDRVCRPGTMCCRSDFQTLN